MLGWCSGCGGGPEAEALIFSGVKGGPLRRSNFNKMAAWPHVGHAIGAAGLHFHDLRHTGNHFAAASGASLKDLMARMGHDSERAAIIYQHEAHGADLAITSAIDAHIETAKANRASPATARRKDSSGPVTARGLNVSGHQRARPPPGTPPRQVMCRHQPITSTSLPRT
ncbi:MAG TPA: tyrosine-type recombinase/integrase [Streptosporangiaceae bacterium]|nr:tyrosine-type recombinase/integrase [Streptosporangiaceae bacterium]